MSEQEQPTSSKPEIQAAPPEAEAPKRPASGLSAGTSVTTVITIACALLAALSYAWNNFENPSLILVRMGANSNDTFGRLELHRLFASAFLHGDILHLFVNMLALWSFGSMLEALLGPRRYLLLYAFSALFGSIASALLRSEGYSVGASGAIWGLMAAGIGIAYWPRGLLPSGAVEMMRKRVWAPLVINALYSFRPGIDWRAHFAGGLAGFIAVAFVLNRGLKPLNERESPADIETSGAALSRAGAWIMGALMGASVLVALLLGKAWTYRDPPKYSRVSFPGLSVTAELPKEVSTLLDVEKGSNETTALSYGSAAAAPVLVEVIYSREPEPIPAEERESFMEALRAEIEKTPPKDFKRQGNATRLKIGDKDSIFVEYKLHQAPVKSYHFVQGDRMLHMRFYFLDQGATGWKDVGEHVVGSVRNETVASPL